MAGGLVIACGVSDAGECLTGTNLIRDGLMGGNQDTYDLVNMGSYIGGGMALEARMMYPPVVSKSGSNLKAPSSVNIDSHQLGRKWGKHKSDYPHMNTYTDYRNYINEVFGKPDKIVFDSKNKEYLYIKGNDLLRLGEDGEFISLYPGAQSQRVINAIANGGEIWP